jgi:transposase
MIHKHKDAVQQTLWVRTEDLVRPARHAFYEALDALLRENQFDAKVRDLCAPFYKPSAVGHPATDPAVISRMFIVGFLEGINSERAIELRCADSLSLRAFLGLSLTENVPDHSTLSRFRTRISLKTFQSIFTLYHPVLAAMGLMKGENLGMDTSVIDANASMRKLKHKITGEKYRAYVKRLAKNEGIDPKDEAAVTRFDRKRKKKTSNEEWENPHDPDAKIGPTKQGDIRMIYKPEHTVDMDTGALIDVQVQFGDMHDAENLTERICAVEQRAIDGLGVDELPIKTTTTDCGYYKAEELPLMKNAGIRANIPDRTARRNLDKLSEPVRKVVEEVRRRVASRRGKKLLRKRGMYVERSFAHILDAGGMRRTTLRGRENIEKRYLMAALGYNLSLILLAIYKVGRPKAWVAKASEGAFSLVFRWLNEGLTKCHRIVSTFPRFPQYRMLLPSSHVVGVHSC